MNTIILKKRIVNLTVLFLVAIPSALGCMEKRESRPEIAKELVYTMREKINSINDNYNQLIAPARNLGWALPHEIPLKIAALDELIVLFNQIKIQNNRIPFADMIANQTNELETYYYTPTTKHELQILHDKAIQKKAQSETSACTTTTTRTASIQRALSANSLEAFADNNSHQTAVNKKIATIKPIAQKLTTTRPSMRNQSPVTAISGFHQLQNTLGKSLEDTYSIISNNDERFTLAAVFDGHGGNAISTLLEKNLGTYIVKKLKQLSKITETTVQTSIRTSLKKFDNFILSKSKYSTIGCTAVIAVIDTETKQFYIANLGDSRAILVRPGMSPLSKPLSTDHKATNPVEQKRIEANGGKIIQGHLWGKSAVTRSFGDQYIKIMPMDKNTNVDISSVMSDPTIIVGKLQPYDQFLILACDGLWDKLSNDEAGTIVENNKSQDPSSIAQTLTKQARTKGSHDDITAIVIRCNYND